MTVVGTRVYSRDDLRVATDLVAERPLRPRAVPDQPGRYPGRRRRSDRRSAAAGRPQGPGGRGTREAPPTGGTVTALRKHAAADDAPAPRRGPRAAGPAGVGRARCQLRRDLRYRPAHRGGRASRAGRRSRSATSSWAPSVSSGEGVEDWSVGDRVVCEPHSLACTRCHLCRRGLAHLCAHKRSPGWGIDGGFAERVTVPAHLLHAVPDPVDDVAAGLVEPLPSWSRRSSAPRCRRARPCVVIGPGPIGSCPRSPRGGGAGRTVVLVGRRSSPVRLELAAELGLEVWDSAEADVAARAYRPPATAGSTWWWSAAAPPRRSPPGLGRLRRRGRLCVLGVSGGPALAVPWDLAMQRARTSLLAVVVLVELGRGPGPAGPRRGRPHPAGYRLRADRLGRPPSRRSGTGPSSRRCSTPDPTARKGPPHDRHAVRPDHLLGRNRPAARGAAGHRRRDPAGGGPRQRRRGPRRGPGGHRRPRPGGAGGGRRRPAGMGQDQPTPSGPRSWPRSWPRSTGTPRSWPGSSSPSRASPSPRPGARSAGPRPSWTSPSVTSTATSASWSPPTPPASRSPSARSPTGWWPPSSPGTSRRPSSPARSARPSWPATPWWSSPAS